MDTPHKHGWQIWLAMAALLPILYVASFGPACWLMSRTQDASVPDAYYPIGWSIIYSPRWLSDLLTAYAKVGIVSGNSVYVQCDSDSVVEIN